MIDCNKQSDESTQDYQYFSDYLNAGPARSLALFADLSPYDRKYVLSLSIKHHWAERCRKFDLEHAPELVTNIIQESTNAERFERTVKTAALICETEIVKYLDLVKLSLNPQLGMQELLKLLDAAVQVERLLNNQPGHIDEHRISGDDKAHLIDLLKHPKEVSLVEEILTSIQEKEHDK